MPVRAVDLGIGKLYHYERFEPAHLEDTLVKQHVHVSNPQHFNDPWDCYPCFDTTRVIDPAYRARCIREVFRSFPLPHLPAAKRNFYERKLQSDHHFFEEVLQTEFRESIRNMIVERWRIYCLTPNPDNPLMWSHYSDKHRGICLEFDACQAAVGCAVQVGYRHTLPALDILAISSEVIFQIFATKSLEWSREHEYRILARDGRADDVPPPFLPLTTDDFLPLAPGTLTGIIAGCRADVDAIKALVEKHAPGLPVKRAVQALDKYSLSIQD